MKTSKDTNETLNQAEEKCKECGRLIYEYDRNWSCKKNHDWRRKWRKDKTSEKYKKFLERRNKAMKKAWRRRLDRLNKKPPIEYTSRRGSKVLEKTPIIKRKRTQYRKFFDSETII